MTTRRPGEMPRRPYLTRDPKDEALQQIRLVSLRLERVQSKVSAERVALTEWLREARKLGASWGALATASGLSRERVRQIVGGD